MATSLQAFDGDTLEAALARVAEECGPRARIAQAEKVRTGGVAGFFARERFEVLVEIDEQPTSDVAGGPPESTPHEPMSLLELADQVSDRERPPSTAEHGEAERLPSTEGRTFQEVLRGIAAQAGLADHLSTAPAPVPSGPELVRNPSDVELFASLGIPRNLLVGPDADVSVAQRLLAVLERAPVAAPVIARRGDVLVAVGEGADAKDAAGVLAHQVGQSVDDVVIAGPDERGFNTVHDVAEAEARVQLWRRCGVPFVVAVCAPPGPWGATWASEIVAALEPVTTWAAVSAARKPEDVRRWVRSVGGVDALAVAGSDATASPAAVLATGIPVAALEGRRATPAAWTALLVERLMA